MIGCAVDSGSGREDEVVDVVGCDDFEHLCCGVEVDLEVFVGLLHRFTDCFERCGVDDAVWLVLLEGLGKGIYVADIGDNQWNLFLVLLAQVFDT